MHAPPPSWSGPGVSPRRRWLLLSGCGAALAGVAGFSTRQHWLPGRATADEDTPDVCIVAPPVPHDPASGMAADMPRPLPPAARCPVCGMYPARAPLWAAQVLYRDGHAHFLDSPVDLFQFLSDVPRHAPGYTAADLLSRWVTDAVSGQWMAMETAWFVHGSDALGPMRRGDLPAFASPAEAARFATRHGGQALPFAAVSPQIIQPLAVERRHALHAHLQQEAR